VKATLRVSLRNKKKVSVDLFKSDELESIILLMF
jgi:hypothetical protein